MSRLLSLALHQHCHTSVRTSAVAPCRAMGSWKSLWPGATVTYTFLLRRYPLLASHPAVTVLKSLLVAELAVFFILPCQLGLWRQGPRQALLPRIPNYIPRHTRNICWSWEGTGTSAFQRDGDVEVQTFRQAFDLAVGTLALLPGWFASLHTQTAASRCVNVTHSRGQTHSGCCGLLSVYLPLQSQQTRRLWVNSRHKGYTKESCLGDQKDGRKQILSS